MTEVPSIHAATETGDPGADRLPTPEKPSGQTAGGLREWFVRSHALTRARALQLDPRQRVAIRKARQALELADTVLQVPQDFRAGPPIDAAWLLCREAVHWALRAACDPGTTQRSLAEAWSMQPELVHSAAATPEERAELSTLFLTPYAQPFDGLEADKQTERLRSARTFAGTLVDEVGQPDTRLKQLELQRWLRPLGALVATVLAIALWTLPKDLAAGKTWRTSSADWNFGTSGEMDQRGTGGLLFHTRSEANPWFIVDLGAAQQVRSIKVTNRVSCCQERAIPLVVELSSDGSTWRQIARRSEPFSDWHPHFAPISARYVRLRVLGTTLFHLQSVQVLD
jgi:hypothetical protein